MKKTVFTEFVGNCARTRVIEYFLTWEDMFVLHIDLVDDGVGNVAQVAKEIGYLTNNNFIVSSKKGYILNKDNLVAKRFLALFKSILKQDIIKLESKLK